jgi:hypothetical protein
MKNMHLLATSLILASCVHTGDLGSVKGSGTIATETRQITGFTKVALEGAMDVYITKGENESVRIEADENLLKLITTKIDNGELEIGSDMDLEPSKTIKVYVTARVLEAMSVEGSGDMIAQSAFASTSFAASIAGSGDITGEIQAEQLDASIAGSGDIKLKGSANKMSIDVAGSGDVNTIDLVSKSVDINIAGSGDCQVHAVEAINANVMGSGNIQYRGEPKVTQSIMGSGSISKK